MKWLNYICEWELNVPIILTVSPSHYFAVKYPQEWILHLTLYLFTKPVVIHSFIFHSHFSSQIVGLTLLNKTASSAGVCVDFLQLVSLHLFASSSPPTPPSFGPSGASWRGRLPCRRSWSPTLTLWLPSSRCWHICRTWTEASVAFTTKGWVVIRTH